jgi:chromosome segregation and condensation protein ScpB
VIIYQSENVAWDLSELQVYTDKIQICMSIGEIVTKLQQEVAAQSHFLIMSNGSFGGSTVCTALAEVLTNTAVTKPAAAKDRTLDVIFIFKPITKIKIPAIMYSKYDNHITEQRVFLQTAILTHSLYADRYHQNYHCVSKYFS